jgi:Rrf2 family protein
MMVAITREGDGTHAVSLGHVAASTMISRRYLEQLAIGLKRAGLIHGVSGRKGGYLLAHPPADVTVGQIVEATIGPINIVDCVLEPGHCVKADVCECRSVYERINDGIRRVLHSLTLEELANADGARGLLPTVSADGFGCPTGDGDSADPATPRRP